MLSLAKRAVRSLFQGFDEDAITYSTPNSQWEVLHTFQSGQEIEIDVVIVYYHWVRGERHTQPIFNVLWRRPNYVERVRLIDNKYMGLFSYRWTHSMRFRILSCRHERKYPLSCKKGHAFNGEGARSRHTSHSTIFQ